MIKSKNDTGSRDVDGIVDPRQSGESQAKTFLSRLCNGFRAAWNLALLLLRPAHHVRHGARFMHFMDGDTLERSYLAYRETETGRAILAQCSPTQDTLFDRRFLASLAEESLGFQYLHHIEDQGLSEAPILAELNSLAAATTDPQREWYRIRIGVTHDLRHLLTGYNTDTMGELCVLVFRFAQTRHPGLPFLIVIACLATLGRRQASPLVKSVREAFQRGKAARLIDLVDWETERHRPLAWHRAKLNIAPPRYYQPALAPDLYACWPQEDGPPSSIGAARSDTLAA